MNVLIEELERIISAFDTNSIEYAVCGSLALAVHGFVRATLDIDLLIQRDSMESVYKIVEQNDYDIRSLDISFKKSGIEIHRISKIDSIGEILPLDLLVLTSDLQEIWNNRVRVDLMGKNLTVVSQNGLIQMKLLSGRPYDLVDIERLKTEVSSAKTVSRRLSQVDQLRTLSLSLMKAGKDYRASKINLRDTSGGKIRIPTTN